MAGGNRSLETPALVVSSRRFKEADQILTLYTRDRGRVSAIAKGIRRTKSRLGGRLEPFSLVEISLHLGRSSLYSITGAQTIRTFQAVRDRLYRMDEGARLLEDIRRYFPEEEENAAAFNLLVRAVGYLSLAESREAAAGVVLAARSKLLVAHGYLPELDSCQKCGEDEFLCAFDPSLGGVICQDCYGEGVHDCFRLSDQGLTALREVLVRPLSEAAEVRVSKAVSGEVERAVSRIFDHHGH